MVVKVFFGGLVKTREFDGGEVASTRSEAVGKLRPTILEFGIAEASGLISTKR